MSNELVLAKKEEHVATLVINRPEKRNTLTPGILQLLVEKIGEYAGDGHTRVIVLTGAGNRAFSGGFDITEIPASSGEDIAAEGAKMLEAAFAAVRECAIPVIAMINGYVIGAGLDLAVNCDFRICHPGCRFGITPAKLGIVYHHAGIKRFLNLVGLSATKYLFYTGKLIDSDLAKHFGLVDFVTGEEELAAYTYNLARELAIESAPLSVMGMKYIVNALAGKTQLNPEEEQKATQYMIDAFNSKDMIEGQMAFIEKRKPNFTGQ